MSIASDPSAGSDSPTPPLAGGLLGGLDRDKVRALPSVRPFEGTADVAGVTHSPFGRKPATELPPDARPKPKPAAYRSSP